LKLAGRTVLAHTLRAFVRSGALDEILIVTHPDFTDRVREICSSVSEVPIKIVEGGASRQESSYFGILACPAATHVLIHDAVRPLISPTLIAKVVAGLKSHDAIDVCIPATDTIVTKAGEHIYAIPPRENMMLGQTPQAFRRDLILQAHLAAQEAGCKDSTDDCGLVLRLNFPVYIESGERTNMKITYLNDIYIAERLIQVAGLKPHHEIDSHSTCMQTALVIGGTSGIGESIASLLRQRGVKTLAVGRQTDPPVDVSCSESVRTFLEAIKLQGKRFDCAIYCPGKLILKNIEDYDEEDWDSTYEINLKGVFRLLRQVAQFLNVGGHFLAVGSSSYSRGRAGYAAYSSSKAALINLIQAVAEELPEFRFNVVSPQRAETGLRSSAFGSSENPQSLLTPEDIAECVLNILETELTGMNFDVRIDIPFTAKRTA
jgi:2-C-methyl-D-erythritol 4-phosphate cytidylyltransferase